MKFKIIFLVFLIILSFGCATKKPIDYNSLMEDTGAVELDADFNGAVDVDKGGTNVQTYPDLKTALSIENVDNIASTDMPVSTDQQTALDLKLDISSAFDPDSPGELGANTPAKGNFTEIEIPFVDEEAGIFWDEANTVAPVSVYGIYPYNGNMYKIENSVHSLMSAGGGGTSIVEVADTPEAWEMIPGTLYIAQDDGELSFLLANSSEVFRYAATSSTLLYPINLTVVSGTTSTVDINGTSYGNGGPYVISALTGATSMGITYDTEDTTVWSGADSGDVTGTSPTFSVNVDAIKTLIATISVGAVAVCSATPTLDFTGTTSATWMTQYYYTGMHYTPISDISVCRGFVDLGRGGGDVTGLTMLIKIWTLSGDDLDTLIGTATGFSIPNTVGPISYQFDFPSSIPLTNSVKYGVTIDIGGIDAVNVVNVFYGASTDAVQTLFHADLGGAVTTSAANDWSIRLHGDE